MAKKNEETTTEIVVEPLRSGHATFWIRGVTPLIYHAMGVKVRRELIFPHGPMTKADKEQTMKHEPYEEYVASTYRSRQTKPPTRLVIPSTMLKATIMSAALEVKGTNMKQIGRLVWVVGDTVDMYGTPQLKMDVARTAGIKKTPDIRTRAILPEWCCSFTVRYVMPQINEVTIGRLVSAAGVISGIGDFRAEKGKGNFGQFELCNESDVRDILKQGRVKQEKALEDPGFWDIETEELYKWFCAEKKKRGKGKKK